MGPYFIVGWSLGGTIAFEMVRQLEQMNEQVSFFALIDSTVPEISQDNEERIFTLNSEKNFIKKYLAAEELVENMENVTEFNQLWPLIVDCLERSESNAEMIKTLIKDYSDYVIPNYQMLSIGECITYLNMIRTLVNAWTSYTPPVEKMNTSIHYFGASQSKRIIKDNWNSYAEKPIRYFEIKGDHFSIFKKPGVIPFAEIFGHLVNGEE